jgi:protein-tyrosine-phosphatase
MAILKFKQYVNESLNEYEKIVGIASNHEKQLINSEFDKVKSSLSMMQSDLRDYYSEEHRKKFDPIRKKVIAMIEKYMKSLPKQSPGWG